MGTMRKLERESKAGWKISMDEMGWLRKRWGEASIRIGKLLPAVSRSSGRKIHARLPLLLLASSLLLGEAMADSGRERFLSEPSQEQAEEIVRRHMRERHRELGLELRDLERAEYRRFRTRRNNTSHFNLRQNVRGIEVVGGDMGLSVDRKGRIFGRWSDFVKDAELEINARRPDLKASEALALAAEFLGLPTPEGNDRLQRKPGIRRETLFRGGTISRDEIPAKLVYSKTPGGLRLAWDLVLRTPDGLHWWNIQIDAVSGDELDRADWISREGYQVYGPAPILTPSDGVRVITLPPSLVGGVIPSPFGWHDEDGIEGAEFTDTRGNNVRAQEDVDGNDTGGLRPDGGPGLDFDFPIDLSQHPSTYREASISNLFYWNNIAHDLFYRYGFDEASGNFQKNNYGRGGIENDAVLADAQDGAGMNNAQFGAPPDGSRGRMEMFIFSPATRFEILSPASIADVYPGAAALFGPSVSTGGLTGDVAIALDPADLAGPSTFDGCSALTNPSEIVGKIALIDRGICNFAVKVREAQDAGAIAALIVNHLGDGILQMAGTDPLITIPSFLVGLSTGTAIRNAVDPVSVNMTLLPMRDGSLDAGIILHEYGHGVTTRLTGGALNSNCLTAAQSAGMGEGWSDFFSLFFGTKDTHDGTEPRGLGTYVLADSTGGGGIRTQPYSTDMSINTLSFSDIATQSVPHGVGEVWAAALWEVFWELVNAHGFDADLYDGTGGNNLALQLVIDALKIQPCEPSFLEARDAILLADLNETGGMNRCQIWRAFAKRGIGDASSDEDDSDLLTTVEDFTLPADCATFCGDGFISPGEECDDTNLIALDGCSELCLAEASYLFNGIAEGGSVQTVINGVTLSVTTSAGETASQVAEKVAAAVMEDVSLAGLGISASANGAQFITSGIIDSITIDDPGLAAPELPLSRDLGLLLAGLLVMTGASALKWGSRRPSALP